MTNQQNGQHRRPRLRTKGKGTKAVGVEIDCATEHDEAEVVDGTADQAAPEIDESHDTDDAGSATDTKDARASGDAPGHDAEAEESLASEDTSRDDAETEDAKDIQPPASRRQIKWSHVMAFGVLPVLALLLAAAAGFAKWQGASTRMSGVASIESVAVAKESTVALLSYQPDSVEKDLSAARDRLTGKFKDSYTQLVHDVVIPGAKKDHVAAVATVPAAASVSATPLHAVALVFVDQTVTVGTDAPTATSSTVRVTLDKSGDRWLISSFDPI